MKHAIFVLFLALICTAQTPPTLNAVNTVTAGGLICTIEVQDSVGGLFVQCKQASDGTIVHTSVIEASADGAVFAHGAVGCLYWTEDAKNRLQCGDSVRVVFDGYVPSVSKKRRWYLFWR